MVDYKRRFQYANPFWVPTLDDGAAGAALTRLTFSANGETGDQKYDELKLQRMLHDRPQALPVPELEPGIGEMIPVGLELPTPAGFVDNLFVTADGNIVLVECKLWRNPDARRRVIAQIIDYAQSISRWSYEEFDAAVRKSLNAHGQPLQRLLVEVVAAAVGGVDELDEAAFIDAVQRNLRMGRMLLLVVGDGIREDVESLADYLQMHAGFHFTLGLVEVAIFRLPAGGFIIQPRILARTLNIERAIVRLVGDTLAAKPAVGELDSASASRGRSMSEELYFEKLEAASPETARALEAFLERAAEDGIFLNSAKKSAALKWESPQGKVFNLGAIDLDGRLQTYSVGWVPYTIGQLEPAHAYLENLGKIVGATVHKTPHPGQWCIKKGATALPPALDALSKPDEWLELIREYQADLNNADTDSGR